MLENIIKHRLLALNPWLANVSGGVGAALIELRRRVNDELLPANKAFWEQVAHRSDIQAKDAEGKPRSVCFFEASTVGNNDFHVVDQYVGRNADDDVFRPDLLLFINGLPIVQISVAGPGGTIALSDSLAPAVLQVLQRKCRHPGNSDNDDGSSMPTRVQGPRLRPNFAFCSWELVLLRIT